MSDITTKDKLENAERQSDADVNLAHARAWELARRQGVKPIQSIRELKSDFWLPEESADEFLIWLRKTRCEDKLRSVSE